MSTALSLSNGRDLTLHHAVPQDAERLLAYLEQVAGESENITFGPGEFGLGVEDERKVLQQYADAPTSCYVIAEIAGELAGTIFFNAGKRPRTQHAGEFGMTVAQKYWNMGVGSHMLAYLIDWLRNTGTIRKINLRVRIDNAPAIHLYAKHGFVQEGRVTRELCVHGVFIDTYIMGLQLDPPLAAAPSAQAPV